MRLNVEREDGAGTGLLPEGGAALVAFMSFAVLRGFGAEHPLLALADRLAGEHGVRMGPLTTFYEGLIEDEEDREKLELAWQPARELDEALAGLTAALAEDAACVALAEQAHAPGLADQARALRGLIREAVAAGCRVRLSYEL